MLSEDRQLSSYGDRLVATYEAALGIAREVTAQGLLQRIVDVARDVVPARYAALGVADEQGQITEFVTSGITPEDQALLGPPAQGHGLLGELIQERAPRLIPDSADDPRSVGFPPGRCPRRMLLGTPILLDDRELGVLYLAERWDEQPFDEEDLALIEIFATHAGAAIDCAH